MTSYTGASVSGWSWGTTWTANDDDGDEEDGENFRGYVTGRDCLLLLVDCSAAMFESSGEEETPFELCIRCCKTVLLNKIISSDKDLIGLVLFGTDKHKNPSDFKHVFILQDLDLPDAPRIKQLEEFLEDSDLANSFDAQYGHSDDYSLSDVFWTCSNMFANLTIRAAHRRILLFTNNDNPHHASISLQRQAKTKAKDLSEAGIELELMHIQPPGGRHFDSSIFYQDLLFLTDDEGPTPDAATKFEELLTRVRSKEHAHRALQRIPLNIAPGLEIGVGVYCMAREAKKPSFVRLDRRSNEELKTQTKYLCDDTGNDLIGGDIKYYQMFGGEKVVFDKEEVDQMKKFDQPGMVLVGFKPRSRLKRHYYVKPANFIYPDEQVIQGSSKLFTALLRRCLAHDVIAICRYIPRTNASPVFVAMVPQDEERDDQGVQLSPPGFHVIYLPFSGELRNLSFAETTKASTTQIDAAKDMIKKLSFSFDSESFENPVLQKHFRTLEAIALEQPSAEDINDLTMPDVERIERRAGPLLEQFKQLVYPPDYEPDKGGAKRKASASGGGAPKRAKVGEGEDVNVEEYAKNKTLSSLTIPILKNYLKSVGRKVAGKKQDLIDSINEHLGIA